MRLYVAVAVVLLLLLQAYLPCEGATQLVLEYIHNIPLVALRNEEWYITPHFSWNASVTCSPSSNTSVVYYRVLRGNDVVTFGSFPALDFQYNALNTDFRIRVEDKHVGYHTYELQMALATNFSNIDAAVVGKTFRVHVIYGSLSLFPPFLTVVVVGLTRNVLLSLFTGIWAACFVIYRFNPFTAFLRSFDSIILDAFTDRGHVQVIMFTWFLSGMVACMLKSGGGIGLARTFAKRATTPRAASIATIVLGLVIFFDGIANTLIVGQTVRPITDALGVSREKLAFLVDATSSPVTSLSPISTWVGFEISMIENALAHVNHRKNTPNNTTIEDSWYTDNGANSVDTSNKGNCYDDSAFLIFIKTIPARYYPFIMIAIQVMLVWFRREFGPMLTAERLALKKHRRKLSRSYDHEPSYSREKSSAQTTDGLFVPRRQCYGTDERTPDSHDLHSKTVITKLSKKSNTDLRSDDNGDYNHPDIYHVTRLDGTSEDAVCNYSCTIKDSKERITGSVDTKHPEMLRQSALHLDNTYPDDSSGSIGSDQDLSLFEPDQKTPPRWWNGVVPVATTTITVLISLIVTGIEKTNEIGDTLSGENIFGNSDSYAALLYGSLAGTVIIWVLSYVQRVSSTHSIVWFKRSLPPILSLRQSLDTWIAGIKSLTLAVLVLLLAWSIGAAFSICGTAQFVSSSMAGAVHPGAYPALTFLISALLAFVTGSSWGTMGIVFPLILPAAHRAAPCNRNVFYGTISSILSGAVFGDHCSPISDTSILAAVACQCSLVAHIKTQAPYAIIAAISGLLFGDLPCGYGVYPDWAGLIISITVSVVATYLTTTPIEDTSSTSTYISPIVAKIGTMAYIRLIPSRWRSATDNNLCSTESIASSNSAGEESMHLLSVDTNV
eukprot:gene5250-7036_t